MAQRTLIYGVYDGKKVLPMGKTFPTTQTVVSQGVQHQMGELTILQEVLSTGTHTDRVSVYVRGDIAMYIYMTTGQFASFETSVMPALSIIGNIAPHAFDLL